MNRPALISVFSDQRRTKSTTRSRTSCGTHTLVRAPQDFFLRPCAQPSIRPAPHPSSGSSFPGTRSVVVRLGGPDGSWTGRQPPRSRRTLFANGRTPLAAAPVPHTDRKPALYPANAVLGCQPSLRQCSASALFACVLSVILTEERSLQFQLRQDSGHARSGEALRHLGHPHHDSPGPQRHHSQTRRRIRVHFGVRIRRAAVAVRLEPRKAWFSSEGNLCGQRTLLAARPMSSIGSIWRIGDFACRPVDFWVVSLWLVSGE